MKECFYCSQFYNQVESTASAEYQDTYCTAECETISLNIMELTTLASTDTELTHAYFELPQETKDFTLKTIGGFTLKVPNDILSQGDKKKED